MQPKLSALVMEALATKASWLPKLCDASSTIDRSPSRSFIRIYGDMLRRTTNAGSTTALGGQDSESGTLRSPETNGTRSLQFTPRTACIRRARSELVHEPIGARCLMYREPLLLASCCYLLLVAICFLLLLLASLLIIQEVWKNECQNQIKGGCGRFSRCHPTTREVLLCMMCAIALVGRDGQV
jgi:hypothetical protein